jgi:hypothetical protein
VGCGRLQLILAAWYLGFPAGGVECDPDRIADFDRILAPLRLITGCMWVEPRQELVRQRNTLFFRNDVPQCGLWPQYSQHLCMEAKDLRDYF